MDFAEVIDVPRTVDVKSNGDFASLMISKDVLENMNRHGFLRPSPVQQRAIPSGLSGFDMLVQAKSGTGKTLVFSVLAVEHVLRTRKVQRLIVAPTREIAVQIAGTVRKVAPRGVYVGVFTGGTSVAHDRETLKKGVQVAVGTSGRLSQLVNDEILSLESVDLFVLDEADQLMKDSFHADINFLFSSLPSAKQVAVFSATYPHGLEEVLAKYMRSPRLIRLNADDVQLIGIKQYVLIRFEDPAKSAVELLSRVAFKQALVFCNLADDCEPTCQRIREAGLDAAFISAKMEQADRNSVIERLKRNDFKVLVSTDLTARGIDATNVNFTINMEPAVSVETYFHRIGRAARYGGYGAAVTILSDARNCGRFRALVRDGGIRAKTLREIDAIPFDLPTNEAFVASCESFVAESKVHREATSIQATFTHVESTIPSNSSRPSQPDDVSVRCAYERDEMLEIGEYCAVTALPSVELAKYLDELGLSKSALYSRELEETAATLRASKATRENNKENEEPISTQPASGIVTTEAKQKKFVPSRLKSKKKFYLRGELIRILELATPAQWNAYANTRFDLNAEPFLTPVAERDMNEEKTDEPQSNTPFMPSPIIEIDLGGGNNGLSEVQSNTRIRYHRRALTAVSRAHPADWWRKYVKSRFDTTEEPFEMDPALRCSFEERLRRMRLKEHQQRRKVIDDRKKAVEEGPKVVAKARTASRRPVTANTWTEYCELTKNLAPEEVRSSGAQIGPVVTLRHLPCDYNQTVNFLTNWLKQETTSFYYSCMLKRGSITECGTAAAVDTFEDVAPTGESGAYDPVELLKRLKLRDDRENRPLSLSTLTNATSLERMVDDLVKTEAESDDDPDESDNGHDSSEPLYCPVELSADMDASSDATLVNSSCTAESSPDLPCCHADEELRESDDHTPYESPEKFVNACSANHFYAVVMQAYLNTSIGPPY